MSDTTPSDSFPRVFWELHEGLPRQGPGDDVHTRRAFHAVGPLSADPRVVDVACGPGMQTLELVRLLRTRVVAIDNHQPFLEELRDRATRVGVADLVEPRLGDMRDLQIDEGSVDLLWCEGAIYIIGFEKGLREWRRLLRPGGVIAVTEAAWLRPGAPEEIRRFWNEGYPAMVSARENLGKAESCGYSVLDHFALPSEAWWTHYYTPLDARLTEFRRRYSEDEEALAVLDGEALEIDLFRKYHDYYGYVFYVLRRND